MNEVFDELTEGSDELCIVDEGVVNSDEVRGSEATLASHLRCPLVFDGMFKKKKKFDRLCRGLKTGDVSYVVC